MESLSRLFGFAKKDDDEVYESKEKEETLGDALRQYIAYCTGEDKYEKRFDFFDDFIPVVKHIYWIQVRQGKIDKGIDFKLDLSGVKEYYQPASDALLAICKASGTRPYMVVDLLMQGADPNIMEPRSENRPIHYLCRRGCYMGVKYLVEAGADYFAFNAGHRNALLCASDTARTGDQVKLVRYLVNLPGYRYKLEIRDSGNNTAAINAIFKQNIWILRVLLNAGARVTDDHLLDPGQESAFYVSQWLYAASILCDIDQLPSMAVKDLEYELSNPWYRYTSLKGHYRFAPLLFLQSTWKYGQELCYRMCMHKKIFEDRETKVPRQRTAVQDMADKMADRFKRRRLESALREARRRAREKKLMGRELGNEVRELEDWNRVREQLAMKVDEEFSKHLRGKEEHSTVEWVRKKASEQQQKAQEDKPPAPPGKSSSKGGSKKGRKKGGKEEAAETASAGIEWETRTKIGQHYITPVPPLPKTKVSKIPLSKMLEQFHNRTHNIDQRINTHQAAEDFYLRASWVERDIMDLEKEKLPERLKPKYKTNKDDNGERWRIADRSELGLVDKESKWAQLKMSTPLVIPPLSDSDEDGEEGDFSDVSSDDRGSETKMPSPAGGKSFSAPKVDKSEI